MTDTAVQHLLDALPANPAHDGPCGFDSGDLRALLVALHGVNGPHTPDWIQDFSIEAVAG